MKLIMRSKTEEYKNLIKSWRKTKLETPPYIHKDDSILSKEKTKKYVVCYKSFWEYIKSDDFGNRKDKKLHLGLRPSPYNGDLAKAKVFILMLNPGLHILDYFSLSDKEFCRENTRVIRQKRLNKKYPFTSLNPSLSWAPGSEYWRKKLDCLIQKTMKLKKLNYLDTLSYLSKKIAILQLYPYHSKEFGIPRKIQKLELKSARLIREFVKNVLVKEAQSGKILLIVARGAKKWGFEKRHNNIIIRNVQNGNVEAILKGADSIIVYTRKEARGASFGKYTEKIVNFLLGAREN
jgi:hypothetical protein